MLCLLAVFVLLSSAATPIKHLAGPADEFVHHRMVDPATVEIMQKSASRNLFFAPSGDLLASHKFPVEGAVAFVLSFASPVANIRMELLGPNGAPVTARVEKQVQPVNDDSRDDVPVTVYIVEENLAAGTYTFNVYRTSEMDTVQLQSVLENPRPDAVLTFLVDDKIVIASHMQSYLLKTGQDIGLVARAKSLSAELDVQMSVVKAIMEVTLPDGTTLDVAMHDNGVDGGDLVAGDGEFSASIRASVPGDYILESILGGQRNINDASTDDAFERTAQHVVKVSSATIEVAGKALMQTLDSERVNILIAVNGGGGQQPALRAYTEVYGRTSSGELKPACWIGGLVSPTNGFISLELNTKWLELAGVSGSLILRNTYIADVTTSFPVSLYDQDINVVKSSTLPVHWGLAANTNITVTQEMKWGVNPLPPLSASAAAAPDLLMLPGYCADVNPWASSAKDFTNAFFPVDKGNYGNHQYSEKVIGQADARGMTAYGVIGHSQGGMVALHIHNFFWSGVEMASKANGKVLLQSVGTPFNGNTAAGSAANLGEIFGVGCGTNTDLSLDGAANWLAGIEMTSRADLHFYTTTYEQGNFFGDWCSLPMNLILQWPNDGVTEATYAPLQGGKNQGNVEKWCHSTEMTYKPQYTDSSRNAKLNSNAARAPAL